MSKYLAVALMLASAISITSCKIGRKPTRKEVTIEQKADSSTVTAVAPETETTGARPELPEDKIALIAQLMPLWSRQIDFNRFSGKAKINYQGQGQKLEFTANFRIAKDSIIWASVTAFVLPVARVYITPDSIQLVNYMDRTAYKMPFSDAGRLLPAPVDFYMLQHFIVGNALSRSGAATDATDFGGTWNLQMESADMIQQAAYNKADSTMRVLQISTRDNSTQGMIQFGNYEENSGRKFAGSRAVNLTNNGRQYYLDMNFNNVDFDKELSFPFSIPKNYQVK